MNPKEVFESIVQEIENCIQEESIDSSQIFKQISKKYTISCRDLNTIMSFLIGQNMRPYIKSRKMMKSYEYLTTNDDSKIIKAVDISGCSTQSAFNTAFKAVFNMTPSEAKRVKNMDLWESPLTWDNLTRRLEQNSPKREEHSMSSNTIFGIPKEQYRQTLEASELMAIFNLDEKQGNLAFKLAKDLSQPMEKTFQYISELNEFFLDTKPVNHKCASNHSELVRAAEDEVLQFLYFKCLLPVNLAFEVQFRISLSDKEILTYNPALIRTYAHISDMKFSIFLEAVQFYNDHADDTYDYDDLFDEYLDLVCLGVPMDIAFQKLVPFDMSDLEENLNLDPIEFDDSWDSAIEREAQENERWAGERIDIEMDPDNLAFDEDDHRYDLDF